MKSLDDCLSRIGLPSSQRLHDDEFQTDRATLALVMDGQSRNIAFENFDVVMKKTISMNGSDVEKKLADDLRGGCCWEQNTLLQMALKEMGHSVKPLLCRVRWGKPDDAEGPNTGHPHFALKVTTADGCHFLADVGFARTNSVEPINLDVGPESQELLEGCFRAVASTHERFHVLELLAKEEWRPLHEWCDEKAPLVDQESCNWFSCTHPTARFTNQLFACRIVGDERHHILSDQCVILKGHGVEKEVTTETITDKNRLLELIDGVFGVKLVETEGVDRCLKQVNRRQQLTATCNCQVTDFVFTPRLVVLAGQHGLGCSSGAAWARSPQDVRVMLDTF